MSKETQFVIITIVFVIVLAVATYVLFTAS